MLHHLAARRASYAARAAPRAAMMSTAAPLKAAFTASPAVLAVAAVAGTALIVASSEHAEAKSGVDLNAVRAAILKIFHEDDSRGPTLVRLSWHASGTYEQNGKTGGSGTGASMRFEPECKHGANAGLKDAQKLLEPVKAQFPELSYADLWAYAAVVVIEEMETTT